MFFTDRPIDRVVPRLGCGSEPKQFNRLGGDAAPGQIIPRALAAGLAGQGVLPALRDLLMNLKQLVLEMARLLFRGVLIGLQRYFRPLRQPADGIQEADVLVVPDEGEHIAALVAAKAVKNLLLGIDVEAGRLLFVKWAEGGEVGPVFFQRQAGTDHLHDVACRADAFQGCL